MEPRRYLRCLGQPALFTAAGEPIRFRTKKHLALLVYLAVEARGAHRRDRLAELLWPRASGAEARHSLATALSTLRPRLGREVLETTRDQVVLAPGRVALDLERLAAGDVLGDETTGPLEVAAFLDGFDIADASEFMLWKDRQQARLLPAIKDALVILIDRCRRTGDSRQIEQLADRMLALDELSEEAIRAKMEARALAGDRLTALKIFEEWKAKVAEELGAVPSDLVEGMAVRLRRRGWERTTLSDIPTVPTDQWRGRPFVGRSREYRVLYEAWEGVRQGVSAHAMVLGDSGIGKTTLVERLTTAAGLEGAAISRVQCYDLEREIPYATLGTLVHGLLDRPGVSATPPEALAEIGRTVPAVRRKFPTIPAPLESQGETARVRLTEAFQEMVRAIAEEHPVILVVDDLHLADDASLAVLHLMMRRSRGEPIMVMMIARPGELPRSPQAARLREGGPGLGVREVELAPLSEEESRDLLNSLVADQIPPSPSVRRTLLRAAGGFPMVLELLVQDWQTNGDQSLALAVEAMTAELQARSDPQVAYRQIFARMTRALDKAALNVLNLAAVLGHRLNDLSMYALIDLGLGQIMAALGQLSELRVLRDSNGRLEFANELIRAHAYAAVPSPVRKALHTAVADRLLHDDKLTERASGLEIAWHCMRAGRVTEATPHLLEGSRDAIRCGVPDAAERALSSALPSLGMPERAEAAFLLVEVLQEQGRWRESLDWLLGIDQTVAAARSHEVFVLAGLAKLHLGISSSMELVGKLHEFKDIIELSPQASTRVAAARAAAQIMSHFRNRDLASQLLHLVDRIPRADLTLDTLASLGLARALLLYQAGETTASFDQASEVLGDLRGRGAANLVAVQLQSGLGSIKSREGQYEEAVTYYEQALGMAHRLGNDRLAATIRGNLAICYGRLGRYRDQIECAEQARSSNAGEFIGFMEMQLAYASAFGYALKARPSEAIAALTALEGRLALVPSWMRQAWMLWRADILLISGRRGEALESGRVAVRGAYQSLESSAFAGPFARWTALCADTAEARQASLKVIRDLAEHLNDYDALDQVEILCSQVHLERQQNAVSTCKGDMIASRLRRLPQAIAVQLSALQILGSA